jgi:hypothetical protein
MLNIIHADNASFRVEFENRLSSPLQPVCDTPRIYRPVIPHGAGL